MKLVNTNGSFMCLVCIEAAHVVVRYIHGTENTSHYLALSPSYKNPADTAETQGLKATIDSTSQWNSQMERTELIPQTNQNLGTGNLYYHFSVMRSSTNPPDVSFRYHSHLSLLLYDIANAGAPGVLL